MRRRQPIPILHPHNHETLVQFRCPANHTFTVPYRSIKPTAHDLAHQLCPLCSLPSQWTSLDYHIEP